MARWRRDRSGAGIPEELCRFVVSEWPSCCPYGALSLWRQACLDYLADAESEDDRMLPFGERGDFLDVLNHPAHAEVRPLTCKAHWSPAEYRGPAG
jgi:hypothetical protein